MKPANIVLFILLLLGFVAFVWFFLYYLSKNAKAEEERYKEYIGQAANVANAQLMTQQRAQAALVQLQQCKKTCGCNFWVNLVGACKSDACNKKCENEYQLSTGLKTPAAVQGVVKGTAEYDRRHKLALAYEKCVDQNKCWAKQIEGGDRLRCQNLCYQQYPLE